MKYEWYKRILFAIYTVILICQDKNSLQSLVFVPEIMKYRLSYVQDNFFGNSCN